MQRDAANKEAVRALLKLVLWEGAVLVALVASFFMTGSVTLLLIGVVASMVIFAPLFLRWFNEHNGAMSGPPEPEGDERG
jgi:hypothetical protein